MIDLCAGAICIGSGIFYISAEYIQLFDHKQSVLSHLKGQGKFSVFSRKPRQKAQILLPFLCIRHNLIGFSFFKCRKKHLSANICRITDIMLLQKAFQQQKSTCFVRTVCTV